MEEFRIYDTIDSTNKEAHRLLASGQKLHGNALIALHQTEGRGQYGRTWISEPGNHLAMSIILQPVQMPLKDLSLLSLKTSTAVARTLQHLEPSLHPLIKWPNDIYIDKFKLAGILIENSISSSKVQHSVIGIGMNVNESTFPPDLPNPVSLFQLTGKKYEIFNIAKKMREEVMKVLDESFQTWKTEYDQMIYSLGVQNEFEINGIRVKATITGVDEDGRLKVSLDGQESKSYFSHEIKWLK